MALALLDILIPKAALGLMSAAGAAGLALTGYVLPIGQVMYWLATVVRVG